MASWQSEAVTELYKEWTKELNSPDPKRQEPRETNDHWGDLTAEPRGVDYIETQADGDGALWTRPHGARINRVIMWIHGGGFVGGSLFTHRKLVGHVAKTAGIQGLVVTYPHTPEHVHPAQLKQTLRAFDWLVAQGFDPADIVIGADSAAATLALSTVLTTREKGARLPAALYLVSQWVDMTVSNDSYQSNGDRDAYFFQPVVQQLARMFLGATDPRDPYASPAFADLAGLPPLLIQVGGDETLLDDAKNLHRRAVDAGVESQLQVIPEQQHTFQMAAGRAPEADEAIRTFAAWIAGCFTVKSSA
jgi:monoterpene epsilon-lactone hydrolase